MIGPDQQALMTMKPADAVYSPAITALTSAAAHAVADDMAGMATPAPQGATAGHAGEAA